jgi:hypothetical protein
VNPATGPTSQKNIALLRIKHQRIQTNHLLGISSTNSGQHVDQHHAAHADALKNC